MRVDSPHVRKPKTVLDSGFHALDSGFQVLDSSLCRSVELRFWIPIVSGIPDSLSCIPESKAQDFVFHKQTFPRFRNRDSLTWSGLMPSLVMGNPRTNALNEVTMEQKYNFKPKLNLRLITFGRGLGSPLKDVSVTKDKSK